MMAGLRARQPPTESPANTPQRSRAASVADIAVQITDELLPPNQGPRPCVGGSSPPHAPPSVVPQACPSPEVCPPLPLEVCPPDPLEVCPLPPLEGCPPQVGCCPTCGCPTSLPKYLAPASTFGATMEALSKTVGQV